MSLYEPDFEGEEMEFHESFRQEFSLYNLNNFLIKKMDEVNQDLLSAAFNADALKTFKTVNTPITNEFVSRDYLYFLIKHINKKLDYLSHNIMFSERSNNIDLDELYSLETKIYIALCKSDLYNALETMSLFSWINRKLNEYYEANTL